MTKRNTSKCPKTKIFTTKHTNTTKQGFISKSQLSNPCKPFSTTYFTNKKTHTKAYFPKFILTHTTTHKNNFDKNNKNHRQPHS